MPDRITTTPRAPRRLRDLTTGHLGRQVIKLAIPSTAENALFSTTGLIEAFWLGQVAGPALAAASMGTALRLVLISPMMGLSAGGMAVVARHMGAREQREADHAVMQTILLVCLFIVPLVILGQLGGPLFLRWMGARGELLDAAVGFCRIIFAGLLFLEMLPSINGVIRGAGYPEQALYINGVHIAVTMVLEPLLVLGLGPFPALGVRGAAWAAVLGSASGVGMQMLTLISGRAGVRLHLRDIKPDWAMMKRILRIAIPNAAQRFSPNLASALMMRLVSSFGAEVLTAYSLVQRVFGFTQCSTFGLSSVTATMVGQNLGARQPERSARAAFLGTVDAIVAALALIGLVNVWGEQVLGLFAGDVAVLAHGLVYLRFTLLIGVGLAWQQVVGFALTGAGDAISPMLVNVGGLWLIQLPLAWALSRSLGLGPPGIWLGIAVGYLLSGVAMTVLFRRGRWKAIRV